MMMVMMRLAPMGSVLQALVLATRKQRKPNSAMIARMLIMIPQPIHILIPPLAVAHPAGKRSKPLLRLPLHLPQLALRDIHGAKVEIVVAAEQLRVERRRQAPDGPRLVRSRCGCTRDNPARRLALSSLPLEEILNMLQILRRRKVAAAMRHVVLEPVRLLVRFVAVRLGTSERFGQK